MSLLPNLAQLKREPHVATEKHSFAESGRSTPTKKSYFQWTSPSPSLGTSIFAKPAFADIKVLTLKKLEEKRYTKVVVKSFARLVGTASNLTRIQPLLGSTPL